MVSLSLTIIFYCFRIINRTSTTTHNVSEQKLVDAQGQGLTVNDRRSLGSETINALRFFFFETKKSDPQNPKFISSMFVKLSHQLL